MIASAAIRRIKPFKELVKFEFDEHVNLFVGPNASGKSTLLRKLAFQTLDDDFYFGFKDQPHPKLHTRYSELYIRDPELRRRARRRRTDIFDRERENHREESKLRAQQMPWVFIPPSRLNIPFSDSIRELLSEKNAALQDLAQILDQGPSDIFDSKVVYLAADIINQQLLTETLDASEIDNLIKSKTVPYECSQAICRDVLTENQHGDYVQRVHLQNRNNIATTVVHNDMGVGTIDTNNTNARLFVGDLSSGTQGTFLWIWHLAMRMAYHYDFVNGWEKKPAVLLIDEIENHLHPTWQRRVIPALRQHFPGLQIFATTHSPFVVAGLKAGQVHLLKRNETGDVVASTNEQDIIGWTIEEILRAFMGVEDPTDDETATNAARLRELRSRKSLTDDEKAEMNHLRDKVSRDMLAGGPLNAQRERYADLMQQFLKSRLADAPQGEAQD